MRTKTETIVLDRDLMPDPAALAIVKAAERLAETYAKANKICAQIYIARNISLSEKDVVSALAEIDELYREENHN